jgi:trehalose synthase
MAYVVEPEAGARLEDYAAYAHLAPGVQALRAEAAQLAPKLAGRTIWMVNSTPRGGGVAEMLPAMITLLNDLGVYVRWAVIEAPPEFFALTKRIHNLVHGTGEPTLSASDRELYDAVSRDNAEALRQLVAPADILIIHDPQPLGAGARLKQATGVTSIWRCHIGLDSHNAATDAAWSFLRTYAAAYDHAVFSAPEYIPAFLTGRTSVIHPAVDPLSDKNRDLGLHKLVGVLCDSALAVPFGPILEPPFEQPARRLQPDGSFAPATSPDDIGLLYRPTIVQVSRWDRLKGFAYLLEAFVRLKSRLRGGTGRAHDSRHRRLLEHVRLVMAGPEAVGVDDDPEAGEVLQELGSAYLALDSGLQQDIALITLPMASRHNNALMVNALQRASSIVVQNSLREGFGLTATEAMWKRLPVVGSRAVGLRHQIRDGLDGRLVSDPTDADTLADVLDELLADGQLRDELGRTAQRRVYDEFLIFLQLRRWLETLVEVTG